MAVKNEQKLPRKEQKKSEDTSKQKVEARREQRNSIPPLEQRQKYEPKQAALNEALANAGANMAANAMTDAMSTPTLATLMQQYAQRAERQGNIAPGSIDPNRDTVYRVGGADPYGEGNYYSQSQLNNAMSGNDANAIYYATHRQDYPWGYGNYNGYVDRFTGENPQEFNDWLRSEGYGPATGVQSPAGYMGDVAYVTGAGAELSPRWDDSLQAGVGSPEGIPREYLSTFGKHMDDRIDRNSDWYRDYKDRRMDFMNGGRRNDIQRSFW